MAADQHLSVTPPRVLIVSRRSVRKNKLVDFVGEYHLDLIVKYGAVPVIVPRVSGIDKVLESFEPIHGILLCEGEDIDPSLYQSELNSDHQLSAQELDDIRRRHASDTAIDKEKDSIELRLAKLCLDRNIPYLGICRGSQVLNVASGGTLYRDIDKEVSGGVSEENRVAHINYDNYDGHRHVIRVLDHTPLHRWFNQSLTDHDHILVNSYHHQGVKRLAPRFVPMAFAPDGLIEAFYDPDSYDPDQGKFIMGLQFHPERMRKPDSDEFDYPGCPCAYQEFVKAVRAYQKKLANAAKVPKTLKLAEQEFENKRKVIVRSLSLAKDIYLTGNGIKPSQQFEIQPRADFLEVMSQQQQPKLTEMEVGATKRNSVPQLAERENVGRNIMGKMSVDQLVELMSFYRSMGQICSEVLERKLLTVIHS